LKAQADVIDKLINPDETVTWSHFVTDDRIEKHYRSEAFKFLFLFTYICAVFCFIVFLLIENIPSLLQNPIDIIRICVFFLFVAFAFKIISALRLLIEIKRETSAEKAPRYYIVTNQRLLSMLLHGEILNEVIAEQIESIAPTTGEDEILVNIKGDLEAVNSFYMHMLDDRDLALKAINELKPNA